MRQMKRIPVQKEPVIQARPIPCRGRDPLCPCQDGDLCHYVSDAETPAWPLPVPTRTTHG